MASDGYVTIHRTTDAAQGELLAEMLRREGIDARFHRVSSALIGFATSMIEMTVDVPAAAEPRARQLIADLEYAGAAEALDQTEGVEVEPAEVDRAARADIGSDGGEGEDQEDEGAAANPGASRGPGLSNRRPIFAAGFAVFVPGAGHLYARRAWTALLLAGGAAGCLWIAVSAPTTVVLESAFAVLVAIVACDAIGGVRAARAEVRGEHASLGRQLGRGLILLGIAIVVGTGARFAAAAPHLVRSRQLDEYAVSCSDREIVIDSQGSVERRVQIADLKVQAESPLGTQFYDIGIGGPQFMRVSPGGHLSAFPDVADWLARACKFPSVPARTGVEHFAGDAREELQYPVPHPTACGFSFAFTARDHEGYGETLRAIGTCVPPKVPGKMASGSLQLTDPRSTDEAR